jgi:hypothetical protein
MQLRGWRLSRAGRIVIIVLVVQILGLGVFLPPTILASDAGGAPSPTPALDAALPLVAGIDPTLLEGRALEWSDSRPTRPAPASRPPELPRAPPPGV